MRNYWQLQAPDGGALHTAVHSKAAVSLQSTAWMERRRPALPEGPRSELGVVLCAKRIKSFRPVASMHFPNAFLQRLHWARATSRNRSAHARARQTYRGRQLQTQRLHRARSRVNQYPLPQSSCSSRAARRKAPPTRAHKKFVKRRRRRKMSRPAARSPASLGAGARRAPPPSTAWSPNTIVNAVKRMASRDEREMLPLIDAGRASSFDDRQTDLCHHPLHSGNASRSDNQSRRRKMEGSVCTRSTSRWASSTAACPRRCTAFSGLFERRCLRLCRGDDGRSPAVVLQVRVRGDQ